MLSFKKQFIPIFRKSIPNQAKVTVASYTTICKNITKSSTITTPKILTTKPISSFSSSIKFSSNISKRSYSVLTESPEAKIYKYDDIKKIASNPEKFPESVLIDVREPVEYSDGHIPGAINIPFKSSPGALDLNEDDFQENFGFNKPSEDKELVFYCLGGVRSTAAEELASTFGYKKRGNYLGSYEDWQSHENKIKK
ncbi:uncharacterized protein KGF55_003585 [Candida pseudojiufengensis]|uniref:uncharacterized protein n=1 Tax=Candida pseudojiufengensis TaxID=497109 RepID=UPI0022255A2E|nr:uncharacterized protein KGF55_003585 [Candida pseudojiufengensis]KAI5962509.1 hypothetical protein KGF55_003585 [Candida pseudojiufengensis]